MFPLIKQVRGPHKILISYFSYLIDQCLSVRSLNLAETIYAQLIKFGLDRSTFLGNRCLDLYFKLGAPYDGLRIFDCVTEKNTISWNISLNGLLKFGHFWGALSMFDEMPERDVVSWNSMIMGCKSCGFSSYALKLFSDMQHAGVRPSEFTFSILTSLVLCSLQAKQIHGSMIRRGACFSNVVLGNSLIDMYGKLGLVDYAFGVFLSMSELDIISWNSSISSFCKCGHGELALDQFCLMRSLGYSPDAYTVSTVITACSTLQMVEKGKQIFALCIKVGFLSNAIVTSATINLFSKCNRLEDSVKLFQELDLWDSAICNSMISGYANHGFVEDALQLFVLSLREGLRPTEFTISSVLSSVSTLALEHGSQIHSMTSKLGFESDPIVASSLVEMYSKYGMIESAMKIFVKMEVKDLISWNTMIMGLTLNGRLVEALDLFKELLKGGQLPDQITFLAVLLACNDGNFVDEGVSIFSLMEKEHGVTPEIEHYACIVTLLCRAGKLKEAVDITKTVPYGPSCLIWGSILHACAILGDMRLTERLAERMIKLDPQSMLPYSMLAKAYEMRGHWEGVVRVRKEMRQKQGRKVIGLSWFAMKYHVYAFRADQLQHHNRSQDIYLILNLLSLEMEDEDGCSLLD